MATLPASNTLEGGSDETVISTANSGGDSGTAFDVVTIQSPQDLRYDTARASHGSVSARVDLSDSANIVNFGYTWTSETEAWGRCYVYLTGAWTGPSTMRLIGFEDSTPAASGRINVGRDTRVLQVYDADFTHSTTTTAAIAFNAWHRIEWRVLASPTVGEIEVRLFEGDDTSPMSGGTTQTTAGANTKSNIARVTYGSNQIWTGGSTYSFWLDSVQANSSGFPGPFVESGPARLSGPQQLSSSAATVFTSSGRSLIREIHVSNPSGSPVDFTLSIGTDAAGTRLYDGLPIAADTERHFRLKQMVLEDGEILQAFAGTGSVLVLTIDGKAL